MSAIFHGAAQRLRTTLLAAALIGLPACGGDAGPTSPGKGGLVTGTYTLEEVDDEELPVAIHQGAYRDPETGAFFNNYLVQIHGGYIEIREDETFYIALNLSVNADGQGGNFTLEMEGEWDELRDEVVLRIHTPFEAITSLGREGTKLHTDLDMGFGSEFHVDFELFKRS